MALNWTMLDNGRPVPLPEERIISRENGAEITILIPNEPPQGDATAGGSGGQSRTLKQVGSVWTTNQRFVFVSDKPETNEQAPGPSSLFSTIAATIYNTPPPGTFESISVPHTSILSTSFVQPVFAANYLKMVVQPTEDGGLTYGTVVEVRLTDTGLFGWVGMFEDARKSAIDQKREERMGEPLPLYSPGQHLPPAGAAGPGPDELPSYSMTT